MKNANNKELADGMHVTACGTTGILLIVDSRPHILPLTSLIEIASIDLVFKVPKVESGVTGENAEGGVRNAESGEQKAE